jgi:hypothetical protein
VDAAKRREQLCGMDLGFHGVCVPRVCVAADDFVDGEAAWTSPSSETVGCVYSIARRDAIEAMDAFQKCWDLQMEPKIGQGFGARQLTIVLQTMGCPVALMGGG